MLIILATGLILTVLFNFLVFNSEVGIGFSIFAVIINIAVLVLKDKNARHSYLSYILAGFSSIFACLISFTSNQIVQLVDLLSAVLFFLLNLYFSKSYLNFDYSFIRFFSAPLKSGLKFAEGFILSLTPKTWAEHSTQKHIITSLIRGMLIGIPLLTLLFVILSKADPAFQNITFSFLDDVWVRLILSIIVFVSSLSLGVMKIAENESRENIEEASKGKEYELLVILGGLAILFGGFIFIQYKYLFSTVGERELLSLGIKSLTYSEYVKKGFFELLLACVISAGAIFYVLRYIHKLRNIGKLLVQLFSAVVTVEVGVMLFSAAQRIFLYQAGHGLTRARVFGMFFLFWLAVLLVILLIKILRDLNNKTYLSLNIISTILVLISLNFIDVDRLIATKYKPTVNGEIDYYYLSRLSAEAHDSWLPAVTEAEKVMLSLKNKQSLNSEDYRVIFYNLKAIEAINIKVNYLNDKYAREDQVIARIEEVYENMPLSKNVYSSRKWQSVNLGEMSAFEFVKSNQNQFIKLPALYNELLSILNRIDPVVINNTVLDRSINPPLSD